MVREMHSSPRRGKGHSKRLSDGFTVTESLITTFVMAPPSPLNHRMEEGRLATAEEEWATNLQTSHVWATEAANYRVDLQGRWQWGCGGICSRQKLGEQSICNSLDSQ